MGKYGSKRRRDRERDEERQDGARSLRLQELIREEVNFLLRGEVRDGRLDDVFITMVELARDGSRARLWFSAPEASDAAVALAGAAGFMRSRLAEGLGLKRTPDLRFRRDDTARAFAPAAETLEEIE
jgi:ribosome-binding factor A